MRIEIGRPAAQLESHREGGQGHAAPRARGRRHHLGRPAAPRQRLSGGTQLVAGLAPPSRRCARSKTRASSPASSGRRTSPTSPSHRSRSCLRESPTEQEFAIALEFEMRRRGADGVAFETIVASGPNGALPHARPSERRDRAGRARRHRLRGDGRRLPLRHDPHAVRRRGPIRRSCASCSRRSSPPSAPACGPCAPA